MRERLKQKMEFIKIYIKALLSALILIGSGLTAVYSQTIKDFDGNSYTTTTIGTQVWIVENLKTTHYRNGDLIVSTSPSTLDIGYITSPIYQWAYGAKESNVSAYGRLYTWYAVSDSRGVCPVGWHVPSDAEWTTLISFLGGELVAYGKLKESGQTHWTKYDTGTNEIGFTALPGGIRNMSGSFCDIESRAYWWSSTENGAYQAWNRMMSYDMNNIFRYLSLKRNGLSVRCIMNK
jgi:uncharacterized protein (TIGR02145 family)